jgi:hypothetical protein
MELRTLPINRIKSNPLQPRESFNEDALKELADSVKDDACANFLDRFLLLLCPMPLAEMLLVSSPCPPSQTAF